MEKAKNMETGKNVFNNLYDIQRMRLEKLMKHPEKPAYIPPRSNEQKPAHVPEFVRNVMGSSAGAGSGEFHVYRHLRRKEYTRQKQITELSEKEKLDNEYKQNMLEKKRLAEKKTAKKRAKRLKNKAKRKANKLKVKLEGKPKMEKNSDSNTDSNEDTDNDTMDNNDTDVKDTVVPKSENN